MPGEGKIVATWDQLRDAFDEDFYRSRLPDDHQPKDLLRHYLNEGWLQGLDPCPEFSTNHYLATYSDVSESGENPFLHWIRIGRADGRSGCAKPCSSTRAGITDPVRTTAVDHLGHRLRAAFDTVFYLAQMQGEPPPADPFHHYFSQGWRAGRDPNANFSTTFYLATYPDVARSGENPFRHYIRVGRSEGRKGRPPPPLPALEPAPAPTAPGKTAAAATPTPRAAQMPGAQSRLLEAFDETYYVAGFSAGDAPEDPFGHYLNIGWREGRDPSPEFSVRHYLAMHEDVRKAGIEPFTHYVNQGCREGRAVVGRGRGNERLFAAHAAATAPGAAFEEFDPDIGLDASPSALVLAYYLPQFHAIPENDRSWGRGFTEWRNVARAVPRFEGHLQPKLPRDLGFYDLSDPATLGRQIALAKAAGIGGFCFYYYWFNGQRVLDRPVEQFLSDRSLQMPFCLMWANENWTRTWDGDENHIILKQDYRDEDDTALVDDFARHIADARYIHLEGRPILFIYRPGMIPDAKTKIATWRRLFRERHDVEPLIFMAQGFGDTDPRTYRLDGAIEFPPHKLAGALPDINHSLNVFDGDFKGHVRDWDGLVERSLAVEATDFPLIQTAVPQWDNEARRPGRGMVFQGSTPDKFEAWVAELMERARLNPVYGEAIVCINAWNEWAEGSTLEPDVHYGAAYLNAVSRAVHRRRSPALGAARVLIVGHDAQRNGAQVLALKIGTVLKTVFGVEVTFLLGADGPLADEYTKVGRLEIIPAEQRAKRLPIYLKGLVERGFKMALTNTVASGWAIPVLKRYGLRTVTLVHELPSVIRTGGFQPAVRSIASFSDRVIFPAEVVREAFQAIAGKVLSSEVQPQGLYDTMLLEEVRGDDGIREQLGIPGSARLVVTIAYGDLRKGVDRFVSTAISACQRNEDVHFVWVGPLSAEAAGWVFPDIEAHGMSDRIHKVDYTKVLAPWYCAADVFFLPSREDPFPSVVLEALATGLPVVGYRGTGGCDPLIERHGRLVSAAEPGASVQAIEELLAVPKADAREAEAARRADIADKHDFEDYCFYLLQQLNPGLPAVSAIVPLYNYERYAEERIDTVLRQSAALREVIVLDDASPDDSLAVAGRVAARHGRSIRTARNTNNAGSPFRQWRKGLELARGEYAWIAEADDVADPELVSRIIKRMSAAGSAIGYADSWQIGSDGERLGESYKPYMSGDSPAAFDADFDMDGPEFVRRFLCVRNVILNVSSAVIRRDALEEAMAKIGPALDNMKVAGDWWLYLEICAAGGRISYIADPLNGHRRHSASVTHALNPRRHIEEIAQMQMRAGEIVDLHPTTRKEQSAYLEAVKAHLSAMAS